MIINIVIMFMVVVNNITILSRDYKWNDMSCDDPAHYICEMRCAAL